ncbi:hypothetical protein EDC01DRAFT_763599 [Geopyxis carbonaria]|nr:hypothetical protein EDC01DRAFT_763599 [Geopyxis carbonaria]
MMTSISLLYVCIRNCSATTISQHPKMTATDLYPRSTSFTLHLRSLLTRALSLLQRLHNPDPTTLSLLLSLSPAVSPAPSILTHIIAFATSAEIYHHDIEIQAEAAELEEAALQTRRLYAYKLEVFSLTEIVRDVLEEADKLVLRMQEAPRRGLGPDVETAPPEEVLSRVEMLSGCRAARRNGEEVATMARRLGEKVAWIRERWGLKSDVREEDKHFDASVGVGKTED